MIYPFPVVTGKLRNHSLDEPSRMSETSVQSLTKPLILQAGFSLKPSASEPSQTAVGSSSSQPGASVSHGFIGTSLPGRCASHFSIYLPFPTRHFRNPSTGEWEATLCGTAGCSLGWSEQGRGQKIGLRQFREDFLRANSPLHGGCHPYMKVQNPKDWLFNSPGFTYLPPSISDSSLQPRLQQW